MARQDFGAAVADFVVVPSDGVWGVGANTPVTFWDQPTDGTQYTDLTDLDGNPITQVTSDENGQLPRFRGPDGVAGMWADAGSGRRAWLPAHTAGAGADGTPGAHWLFGDTSPDEQTGLSAIAGDLYVDTTSGDLYTYDGATWTLQTNIRGPQGPAATVPVTSVNTQTGDVVLDAAAVGALATTTRGTAGGVAPLDASGLVPVAHLPVLQVIKSADTARTTATISNDPHLSVLVAANARYLVLCSLTWTTDGTTGRMQVGWSYPSGCTMTWNDSDTSGYADISVMDGFSATDGTLLNGVLVTSSTAGTFALRWAQREANTTTPATLKQGSGLVLIRIA